MNSCQNNARFTVFGASGYIGSNLVEFLRKKGVKVSAIGRADLIEKDVDCGHLVYAAGVTADFRHRILDTVDAHVTTLANLLRTTNFDSLIYLSSTRVYQRARSTDESTDCIVNVSEREDLYNLSKLLGESLCIGVEKTIKILRISNVYSRDFSASNFLSTVVRDACEKGEVVLQSALASEKDYVLLEDVLSIIESVAEKGRHQLYNVASGVNTTNGDIAQVICAATGCSLKVVDDARTDRFPPIQIERLSSEFDFHPTHIKDKLPSLIQEYLNSMRG